MKTYAIFGLGKSGKASAAYLDDAARFVWDDNETSREGLSCTHPDEWDWSEIDALILAPGIPLTHPEPHYIVKEANKHDVTIICDVEILWQDNKDAFFIGITGTNGKSTTTALLEHILKTNGLDAIMGGNIGDAALSIGKHKYYVIEMSSYQLDLIDETRFNIAIWLNLTPDHIDRHGDFEGYRKAKERIFKNGNDLVIKGDKEDYGNFPNLPGKHNMQNISAAYKAAKHLGIEDDKIIASIKSFNGLPHRAEFVKEVDDVKFVNDSKATNAESTACALETFDDVYWIVGGVSKAEGIAPLERFYSKIKKAYLIGEAANDFAKDLDGKVEYEISGNMQSAVKSAASDCKSGVILLSPACASFDQYKNFEERGDDFKKIVLNI